MSHCSAATQPPAHQLASHKASHVTPQVASCTAHAGTKRETGFSWRSAQCCMSPCQLLSNPQVGKTGGAWITQALLLGMGSLTAALPIISASFVAVVGGWIAAVVSMGRQMEVGI